MELKSEGQLQFERGVTELRKRIQRGEFNDPLAPGREFSRLLSDAEPKMTLREREAIQHMRLNAHQLGALILSENGMPVAGNDPKKPN